jgi:hypothetical protein
MWLTGGIPVPEWTPELALEFMDAHGIAVQMLSVSDPGVEFVDDERAPALARECNDFALRWRDVDWAARRVRVRRNYTRGEFGVPKSRRSARAVPLADEAARALERLRLRSNRKGDDDLVFAHPLTGGVLAKSNISRRMHVALKAAGLDETHRFHDLRHTFGTQAAAAGVPMRTLQEWMGHADHATTLIYADYSPGGHELDMIERAFVRGSNQGSDPSEEIASRRDGIAPEQ